MALALPRIRRWRDSEGLLDRQRIRQTPALDVWIRATDRTVRKDRRIDGLLDIAPGGRPARTVGVDQQHEEIGDFVAEPASAGDGTLPGLEFGDRLPVPSASTDRVDAGPQPELVGQALDQRPGELLMATVLAIQVDPWPLNHPATRASTMLRRPARPRGR